MAEKNNKNTFESTVANLFKGMDAFMTTKTVVGDAIHMEDETIILPLVDVSFGIGAGAFAKDSKNNSAGGITGKITPSAVLVIKDGTSKMVGVKDKDGVSKILDMIPDVINKFKKGDKKEAAEEASAPSEAAEESSDK